jgi:Icc-related predicted phosphoesterase
MRCLLVADLHYDLRKFDWVIAAARHMDVVVLAGDHLDAAATVARSSQAVVVQQCFRRIRERVPLLVCSGNHDLDHRDARGVMSTRWIARARHLDVPADGDSRLIGDTLFTSCPWSDSVLTQRAVAAQLERAAAERPACWVWIHHAPPAASPVSWDGRRCHGDPGLHALIEQHRPDFVLSGHVHQAPFTRQGSWAARIGTTWAFNAGHQIGPVPSHLVVDTERREAFWCSLAATELTPLIPTAAAPFPPVEDPPAWLLAIARPAAPSPG